LIPFLKPDLIAAVPQPRFRPASHAGMPDCFVANLSPGQPVLVAVHGISRNAAEIAMRFALDPAFAETTIIAPLFTREAFGQYQQLLARKSGQVRADHALLALLDDLAAEHGLAIDRFALFGFSGGAQMAHRFAMFHPGRVKRLCVVSAGWYCMPHTDIAYPLGIGDGKGGAIVGPEFLDIPTAVIVGNRDIRIDASVRQDEIINLRQGRNRLRRARCYTRALRCYAENHGKNSTPTLLTLPGMSHDFHQCVAEGGLLRIAAQALL
jgi:dienelactone hydrolase